MRRDSRSKQGGKKGRAGSEIYATTSVECQTRAYVELLEVMKPYSEGTKRGSGLQ